MNAPRDSGPNSMRVRVDPAPRTAPAHEGGSTSLPRADEVNPIGPRVSDWQTDGSDIPGAATLLRAVRKRWLLCLVLGTLVGGAAGSLVWLITPANYVATAFLRLRQREDFILRPLQGAVSDRTYRNTQSEILRLPHVLRRALMDPVAADVAILRGKNHPEEWLRSIVQVELPQNTEIMRVSVAHEQPEVAQALVNAVTNAYLSEANSVDRAERQRRREELERLSDQADAELKDRWEMLQDLAGTLGTGNPESLSLREQIRLESYREYAQRLRQTRFLRQNTKRELARLRATLDEPMVEVPDHIMDELVEQNPAVLARKEQILALDEHISEYETLDPRGTDSELLRLRRQRELVSEQLEHLKEELRPEYTARAREMATAEMRQSIAGKEATLANVEQEEEFLTNLLGSIEKQIVNEGGESGVRLEMLRREIDRVERIADNLWNSRENLRIEDGAQPRVSLIAAAETPRRRNQRTRQKAAVLAAGGGFGLVLVVVGLLEYRTGRVTLLDDLSRRTGIAVVGSVTAPPHEPRILGDPPRPAGHRKHWRQELRESVDALAAKLMYCITTPRPRSILVTSASSGEGKSTVAVNLAASLARAGKKTLVIDFDLRQRSLHRLFEVPSSPGIADVLCRQLEQASAIVRTRTENLDFLPSGHFPGEPYQVLTDPGLGNLLADLKSRYDFVVLDTPPVLEAVDTMVVGQHVDTSLFSIVNDVSQIHRVRTATDQLHAVGISVFGAVVCGSDTASEPHHYLSHSRKEPRSAGSTAQSDPPSVDNLAGS